MKKLSHFQGTSTSRLAPEQSGEGHRRGEGNIHERVAGSEPKHGWREETRKRASRAYIGILRVASHHSHNPCSPSRPASPFSRCSSAVAPPPLNACLFTLFLICLGVSLQAGDAEQEGIRAI